MKGLKAKGFLGSPNVEVEVLDGVRPDLLRSLKEDNIQAKVYVTYGSEWYLYLVHRIAEYPPNLYFYFRYNLTKFKKAAAGIKPPPIEKKYILNNEILFFNVPYIIVSLTIGCISLLKELLLISYLT